MDHLSRDQTVQPNEINWGPDPIGHGFDPRIPGARERQQRQPDVQAPLTKSWWSSERKWRATSASASARLASLRRFIWNDTNGITSMTTRP
jgi:hypothetical protein